jgi:hypothetical protein
MPYLRPGVLTGVRIFDGELLESCRFTFVGVLCAHRHGSAEMNHAQPFAPCRRPSNTKRKFVSSELLGRKSLLQPVLLFATGKHNGKLWKMNMDMVSNYGEQVVQSTSAAIP